MRARNGICTGNIVIANATMALMINRVCFGEIVSSIIIEKNFAIRMMTDVEERRSATDFDVLAAFFDCLFERVTFFSILLLFSVLIMMFSIYTAK